MVFGRRRRDDRRTRRRRREVAGEVAEGAADVVDAASLVWAVVSFPFRVLGAVLRVFD